jgi:hypothetical protein
MKISHKLWLGLLRSASAEALYLRAEAFCVRKRYRSDADDWYSARGRSDPGRTVNNATNESTNWPYLDHWPTFGCNG